MTAPATPPWPADLDGHGGQPADEPPPRPELPPLAELALARSTLDRDAVRRTDPALLDRLLTDVETRVLVLDGDRGLVTDAAEAAPRLVLLSPDAAQAALGAPAVDAPVICAYLGIDGPAPEPDPESESGPRARAAAAGRRPHVLLAALRPPGPATPGLPMPMQRPAPPGARWAGLREVGALLDGTGAGLLTAAVALSNWHATHQRCARCGEPTQPSAAGWSRRCPACGAEHYPRTDPAVIMAVVDDAGRILLGRQASWPPRRYSTLAGFVEPGESPEGAVRREVFEEAGIHVGDVAYQGSQPWPFPSSLMLGYAARATSTEIAVDGDELAHARWWTREQLVADVATGELVLPPGVSIARRLIEQWFGGPLVGAGEAWR